MKIPRSFFAASALAVSCASCATLMQPPADPSANDPGPVTVAQPPGPAPLDQPPLPPATPPPPVAPSLPAAGQQLQPQASGQWVYTYQYGWVWMPYADQYVYLPVTSDAYPFQYVFSVSGGWRWVEAPWVWGWGARPWYGHAGPRRFSWYHSPDFYGPGGFDGGRAGSRRR